MIAIKTPEEIKILREGGKILASILLKTGEKAKAGISTKELDEYAEFSIREAAGEPAFKYYKTSDDKYPFPSALCVSINDEVVHGIPAKDRILKEGDIISLDLGLKWRGLYTDAAITVGVGKISVEAKKLLETTRTVLVGAIKVAKQGAYIGDIGFAIQSYVEANGFNVVKTLVGHGVGYELHEDPEIPNWGEKDAGLILKSGTVFAVEPMVVQGNADVVLDKNGWTWKTKDGSLAAHFEHTIVVTKRGAEILTRL